MTTKQDSHIPLTNLRAWRIARVFSQRDLAIRAGVNKMTITNLEGGRYRANLVTVRKLAKALDVEPSALAWGPAPELPSIS
jgi:transcriptional regulator with XRE-family HTH domain